MKRSLAVSLLAACTGSIQPSDTRDPVPQSADQPYQVTTTVDLTVEAVLPAQAEAVVATLREFSMNPAHALIDLAGRAGVPAVTTLYNALPSVLTDKLEGWINGEIDKVKIGGTPITQWAGQTADLFDHALSKFAVDSTLAIDGGSATHTLTAIDFSPAGVNFQISLAALPAPVVTQTTTADVGHAGALVLGEQHYGLNFGDFVWTAVNGAIAAQFGGDVRTVLGNAVNCANVAHVVANKCVLTACVGHESDLAAICEGGLDELVAVVHDQLAAYNQDALEFASGAGTMVDDNGDGTADRIIDGTWDANMNLGMGLRHTPATFVASGSGAALP